MMYLKRQITIIKIPIHTKKGPQNPSQRYTNITKTNKHASNKSKVFI